MELIVNVITPTLFAIGIFAWMLKYYLNFVYFKVVRDYPKDLSFSDFNRSMFSYFPEQVECFFPILLKSKRDDFDVKVMRKLKLLENAITVCIILAYLGVLTFIIGYYLQENYL